MFQSHRSERVFEGGGRGRDGEATTTRTRWRFCDVIRCRNCPRQLPLLWDGVGSGRLVGRAKGGGGGDAMEEELINGSPWSSCLLSWTRGGCQLVAVTAACARAVLLGYAWRKAVLTNNLHGFWWRQLKGKRGGGRLLMWRHTVPFLHSSLPSLSLVLLLPKAGARTCRVARSHQDGTG